jgi:hypothetical protein
MTIRRRCTERNRKNGRRCLVHLRFDLMYRGKRYRIPATSVEMTNAQGIAVMLRRWWRGCQRLSLRVPEGQ